MRFVLRSVTLSVAALAAVVAAAPLAAAPQGPAQAAAPQIYNTQADAKAEVAEALKKARAEHKRVLLDFGGNWCGDCKVLDINFHKPENQELLSKYYVLVDIDVGRFDKNEDVARQYGVPFQKGIPALAVLDSHGKVLFAQSTGEFSDMRHMDPGTVNTFLEKWKSSEQRVRAGE